MSFKRFSLAVALVVIGLSVGGQISIAHGQGVPKNIPQFEMDHVDVREAIRTLFSRAQVSFTIAPEVQGTVTIALRNVSFETALQNLLRQVDATYRIEGGVYQIILREPPERVLSVISEPRPDPSLIRTSQVHFENADVRAALRDIFHAYHISFSIDSGVQGTVTCNLDKVPFEVVLKTLLSQVNATYMILEGVYRVFPAQSARSDTLIPPPPQIPAIPGETTIVQDGKFLYIVQGHSLFKVQKSDLKVVKSTTLHLEQIKP